jgi:tetratricopeptide (TPR) repeat protein
MVKILFLFLIFILPLEAQDRDPVKRFDQAVFLYNNKQYEPALKLFESLSGKESFAYSTPSEIFIGKIYLEQGRTEEAEAKFKELFSSVTENNYRVEILLNSAIVLYNKGMYYESVEMLLDLIEAAPESPYAVYAINVMDTLAVYNLSPDEVKVLYNLSKRELKPLLLLILGKTYLAEGNSKEAKSSFRQLLKEFPQSDYKKEAEDYLNDRKTVKIPREGSPVIVVLFPDESGAAGRAVNQISEGIKYGVHEFNNVREEK